eukprot:2538159-Prymnesium_polylepis.1
MARTKASTSTRLLGCCCLVAVLVAAFGVLALADAGSMRRTLSARVRDHPTLYFVSLQLVIMGSFAVWFYMLKIASTADGAPRVPFSRRPPPIVPSAGLTSLGES